MRRLAIYVVMVFSIQGRKSSNATNRDNHFRNKRVRGFVQLRHGLERTNSQTDEQTKSQNRLRHQQRRF